MRSLVLPLAVISLSFYASAQAQTAVESAEKKALSLEEDKAALDVIASGQHSSISLGLIGQIPIDGEVHLSLGASTTSILPANILDLKLGMAFFDSEPSSNDYWTQFFVGQTQIVSTEAIGLGKKDSRFWFFEGFLGMGPLGVGYRFNFMNDEGGIYIRKTHIAKSLMYPFIALRMEL